ncbi:trypsin-like peptidase domain-containing protein [Chloroflexota bacterium]
MKARITWSVLSCLIILSLVAASCAPVVTGEEDELATAATDHTLIEEATQTPVPTPEILSTGDVVKKVSPAVVLIVTDQGSGTGMFISSDGYVLTNEHVVSESHFATLNLPDKKSILAGIIYRDQALDIAILKSAGVNYPVVILGSKAEPMLGEDVVALGFPSAAKLGSSVSVSKGIISAFRTIDGVNYIQTDASLNPGSSGGPMVNMQGEVIGMNTLKLRETEGISFAIDINNIKTHIESAVQLHRDGVLVVEKPPVETNPPVEKAEEKMVPSAPPEEEWVEWSKTFSGTGDDRGHAVQQTSDGGYIIAGFTTVYARNYDAYLVKTDSYGTMLWSKAFGGSGMSIDSAHSVQQTTDGGYIIAGTTEPSGLNSNDVYLVKTDSSGNMTWSKTYGGTDREAGSSVQQTSDGGYIIAGYTRSFGAGSGDAYLIKTDSSGNEAWSKTFGGTGSEGGSSVQQTSDGGYIIVCTTSSFGTGVSDAYLVKTDSSGNEVWSKTFGGTGQDNVGSVQQTVDGGYIIAGSTRSFGGGSNFYLVKTDSSGNEVWSKTFGGTNEEQGHSVQQTSDGGYIIVGSTFSLGIGDRAGYVEESDVYLVKTDSSGNMLWSKAFGSTGSDAALSVQQTVDGGYIITGYYDISPPHGHGDVYLVKLRR